MKLDLKKLTPEAKRELWGKIAYGLHSDVDEIDDDWVDAMLRWVIPVLDEMDCEDHLGTEGWQHRYGVDD